MQFSCILEACECQIFPPAFFCSFLFSCFALPEGLLRSVPIGFRVPISPRLNIWCAYNNLTLIWHMHRVSVFAFEIHHGKVTNIMNWALLFSADLLCKELENLFVLKIKSCQKYNITKQQNKPQKNNSHLQLIK